jgi:hypothetical protein
MKCRSNAGLDQPFLPFPEPEPPPLAGSPVLDFSLTLEDGSAVEVHYVRRFLSRSSHFDFRGISVSETGYRSYFPHDGELADDPDEAVIGAAKEIAEILCMQMLRDTAKETRRRKRKTRNK